MQVESVSINSPDRGNGMERKVSFMRKKETAAGSILSLLLAAALMFSGCGGSHEEREEGKEGGISPMEGTYQEELSAFPEEIGEMGRLAGPVRLEDGSLLVFDYNQGPFRSEDGGKSWDRQYEDWIGYVGEGYYMNCAAGRDGRLFLEYQTFGESEEDAEEKESETGFQVNLRYMLLSPNGEKKELALPCGTKENGYLSNCWYTPDGRLLVSQGKGVYETNQETGETRQLFEASEQIEAACFSEKRMLFFGRTKAYWYDDQAGELSGEDDVLGCFVSELSKDGEYSVHFTGSNYLFVSAIGEDGAVWLGCRDGLYRYMQDGKGLERILAGSRCELGDPSVALYGMDVQQDEALLLYHTGLGHVSYREGESARPERELTIYSLERSRVIQQAVRVYQKAHPEVEVSYEIGLTGEDGQTVEDAAKALNTRILAGEGPDVLLLDGLPLDAWIKKGMLIDLEPLYQEQKEKEPFFENIAEAFRQENGLMVIPTGFEIPLLYGEKEYVDKINDLSGLAEAAENLRSLHPEGSILQAYVPEVVLALLAPSCAPAWTGEDGAMEEEAVETFLTMAQRIYEAEKEGITEAQREEYLNIRRAKDGSNQEFLDGATDISWNVVEAAYGSVPMAMGKTGSVNLDYTNIISVRRMNETTDFMPAPGQAEGAFTAKGLVGISARAREEELAKEFVKLLLSAEILSGQESYPVNRASFRDLFESGGMENGAFGSVGIEQEDGSVCTLDLYWPNEEERVELEKVISDLQTPYLAGGRVEQAVLETGEKVLLGEIDIQEGLKEIREKVRLYLAELV